VIRSSATGSQYSALAGQLASAWMPYERERRVRDLSVVFRSVRSETIGTRMAATFWREDPMADQHISTRTDDADARGEHEYGPKPTPRAQEPVTSSMHRAPNSYVAGENGTQQVTNPPGNAGPEDRRDDRSRD